MLDPLDGTINFAAHQPFFAVSLGLFLRGMPVIGWVCDPIHCERFRQSPVRGPRSMMFRLAKPPI